MATTAIAVTLTLRTAVHLKNIQNSHRQSYQSELLFIQDNVYNDERTVFHHLHHESFLFSCTACEKRIGECPSIKD